MADSAALPRGEKWGNIPHEATYPSKLDHILRAELGPESPLVIERGMRYRTMQDVLRDWEDEIALKRPEILILQVGGSDCAPRVFSRRQREVIERLPARYRDGIISFERKYRRALISLFPSKVYVSYHKFRGNVADIIRRSRELGMLQVIIVNIIPISQNLEFQLPGARKNVEQYNKVFDAYRGDPLVTIVDLNHQMIEWGGPDELTIDGMHMNTRGQFLLAQELANLVLRYFDKKV